MFTEPDPSYHGSPTPPAPLPLRPAQYILKARLQLMRDMGAPVSPFNAFLFLQGLETLSLRMERHCQNAQAVLEWPGKLPHEVGWSPTRGLQSSPWAARADKYLPLGKGAILAFGIRGAP